MSSSSAVDDTTVSHYLHPDFLDPLPSSLDPKQNPLVLLAQTCNNIGKDVSFAHSKKSSSTKSSDVRLSSPPKLIPLKTDEDKQPTSTSTEQRHSPTSTRSPKYTVTPEQTKPDSKALSPSLLKTASTSEDKTGMRCSLQRTTPVNGSPGDKSSPCKSPSSHETVTNSNSFPFPLPHPALLSAAYTAAVPWPTLPFPHIAAAAAASLPGLSCPCGQCSLGSPCGASGAQGGGCGTSGTTHCSCAHCLTHSASGQSHSLVHDSFSSVCFYSGLLNSYLGQQAGAVSPGPGMKTVVSPGVSSSSNPPATSSAACSRTVEYCMYCGKHCPSPEQLLAHLQCHMSTTESVSPPAVTHGQGPSPGLSLYSSSAAADLIRKLYTSTAVAATASSNSNSGAAAAAGLSPRFHPYRSFLPKLSPHRTPFQQFGAPIV